MKIVLKIALLTLMFVWGYGDNLEIVKYVSNNKPKIYVESNNLPMKIQQAIAKDAQIIARYDVDVYKSSVTPDVKSISRSKYKGYNYLLRAGFSNNHLTVMFYNLLKREVLLYKKYLVSSFEYYPFVIHRLSYDMNNKMGYKPIDWINKKVVYSIYMAPKEQSIFIADITLQYRKKIISGGLNIFPKWANKEQTQIYYTNLNAQPVLYKYNIVTGKREKVLSSQGMLIASDVKGDELLLTLAPNDQPDIYKYNTNTKSLTRITKFNGIDVNGQFYGDNSVVFISNRLGYPNVYQKNLDTNKVSKLIDYGKNHISVAVNNDKVVVSTRESNKAFDRNTFNLLLLNKNNSAVKRLTFSGKNMLPSFSSDGGTIIFIKEYKFNSSLGIERLDENKVFYIRISRKIQSFDFWVSFLIQCEYITI